MTYGRQPYAGSAYEGGNPTQGLGGAVIVDPTRPDLPGYRWLTQTASGPYGSTAYAGGGTTDRPAVGGLVVTADVGTGVVRADAWWVNADYLRVVRILPDGSRTAVRGAYPVTVSARSRTNLCTNPSFEVGTTGYLAGSNTTLSRVVAATLDGVAHGRLTTTAAGAANVTVPVLLPNDGSFGVGFALKLSAAPTGALTVTGSWQDQTGAAIGTSTATISSANLAAYLNRWDRIPLLKLTPPLPSSVVTGSGATQATELRYPVQGALTISVAGLPSGGRVDLDAVLVEAGANPVGSYFDGDDLYAQWSGTAGLSTSSLASPVTVYDAEVPLDVPVRYELTAPSQPQYRVLTEPVMVPSGGRTFLSHPEFPFPLVVEPEAAPEESYAIDRGVHAILGSDLPVAIVGGVRQAETGSITVPVENFGQRDRLKEMLADGSPLLLRAPAEFGRGPGQWLSIDSTTITPPGHGAWEATRRIKLPYAEVAAPVSADSVVV